MMKKLASAVLASLFLSAPVKADGNRLLEACSKVLAFRDNPGQSAVLTRSDAHGIGWCYGFLQGLTQTNVFYESQKAKPLLVCLPSNGIHYEQTARIVVKYLKERPESLHMNETILATFALAQAFPCN